MRHRRADEGVAALEMAIVVTLLLVIAFGAVPLWRTGAAYHKVSRVSGETLRFATAVTAHGTRSAPGATLRRRPTAAEVAAFAQQAAGSTPVTVVVLVCPDDVAASCAAGDPSAASAGDGITVSVSTAVDLNAAGALANAVGSVGGGGEIAPQGVVTMTSTAHGREE
ncbi:MAG TPA: TadE/TadG family type IV pilus assembly protein [Mycobacteriales bacterium]|nr:TadE/TadG family type IV pilus assembly protein [Mycobacteriales bacterium]